MYLVSDLRAVFFFPKHLNFRCFSNFLLGERNKGKDIRLMLEKYFHNLLKGNSYKA